MTANQIRDLDSAAIWVMDRNVQFIDDIKPMSENELLRVRGIPGVETASRLYKGLGRAKLRDGNYQQVILLGLDDQSFMGAPRELVAGTIDDLRRPNAVIMDERGARQLWPDDPYRLGRVFEMNDRQSILVGICKASRTFQTFPVVYSRYSEALQYIPQERKTLSFVLVEAKETDIRSVCQQIDSQTGLKALTRDEFIWSTTSYYIENTGIPINFGITVLLGFIVGVAVAGQTFYLFTVENMKQFGTLKAIGCTNWMIIKMILGQAFLVGLVGYGIGVGGAAFFGEMTKSADKLAFFMPWQVLVLTGVAVILIVVFSSILSLLKVLFLEPAIVFRGD